MDDLGFETQEFAHRRMDQSINRARWPGARWMNIRMGEERMTQIIVLPHVETCPDGAVIEAEEGKSICENLLENGIELEHACEMSCACTTCHVIVREGFESLDAAEDEEEDLLDKAWGLEPNSRLGCQALVRSTPLVVEIPNYSINMAKEGHRK